MKSLDLGRYALSIGAAAALLAGCGSSQPPIGVPGATPQIPAIATHVDHGSSRMAPQAKGEDLLYVTRESVVAVYSYPRGTLEGLLTRFSYSLGDCVDKNGKIYITDYTENTIAEYAHGGTQPIKTLSVPGSGPVACAVDPASGDLAVTSAGNSSGGANLAVYSKAKGTRKPIRIPPFSILDIAPTTTPAICLSMDLPRRATATTTNSLGFHAEAIRFKPSPSSMDFHGGPDFNGTAIISPSASRSFPTSCATLSAGDMEHTQARPRSVAPTMRSSSS